MKKEIENVIQWIRDYTVKVGRNKLIIGLSGGIDSAVIAALCAKAVGVNKVYGIIMPCESDPLDRIDAMRVVAHLGLGNYAVNDLTDTLAFYLKGREGLGKNALVRGNIKSRLRMLHLYAIANLNGGVVVGTSNRSELAIGYVTKGGDGQVDFEPLAEYYKTEVYEMAKILGIPQENIDRKPSAGLWENQTDEAEIGMSYKDLDYILQVLDKGNAGVFNQKKLERVLTLMSRSEHKRKMPPVYERNTK